MDGVEVAFTNDYYIAGVGDRNLYVDKVRVNGETIQAENSEVRYDRGWSEAAVDRKDII